MKNDRVIYISINTDSIAWKNPHAGQEYDINEINNWVAPFLVAGGDPLALELNVSLYNKGIFLEIPLLQKYYFRFDAEALHGLFEALIRQMVKGFEISVTKKEKEEELSYYVHSDFCLIGENVQYLRMANGGGKIIFSNSTRWCPRCNHVLSNLSNSTPNHTGVCLNPKCTFLTRK